MFLMFVECAKAIKQKPILHSSRSAHKHVPAAVSLVHTEPSERAPFKVCARPRLSLFFISWGYIERKQNTYTSIYASFIEKSADINKPPFFSIYFRNNFAKGALSRSIRSLCLHLSLTQK
jgi:hypothetical protein